MHFCTVQVRLGILFLHGPEDLAGDLDHGVLQSSRPLIMYHCAGLPERPVLYPVLETQGVRTTVFDIPLGPFHVPLWRSA